MEEKKFRELKAGTRVTVDGRECAWGVGVVVMQSETTGKCLIRFGREAEGLHDSGGMFREKCALWCDVEALSIIGQPEEEATDPKKNWVVLLQSVDGKVSHFWRAESGRFGHGWVKAEDIDPITAMEEWIEGQKKTTIYKETFGLTTARPNINVNVDASEFIEGMEAALKHLRETIKTKNEE